MRKITIILAIAALFAGTTSCKKEYTCECTILGTTTSTKAEFKKKADAEAWCETGSSNVCKLK